MAASLLQTLNNDVSGFNTTNATGWAALAYKTRLGSIPTVAGLSLAYDYFALSGSSYLNQYTATPFTTMIWDAVNLTQFQVRFQAQDFINQQLVTPEDNRDGWDYMGGLIHFFQFEGGQHYIKLGYQIDWDKTKGDNWTYLGNRFLAGFQYTLPSWGWGIRIRDDFDADLRNYTNPNNYLPVGCAPCIHRYDQEFNNLVSISKDLPYNITLSIEYLYDRNISNIALYTYTRNVISFNASWRY